jgi:hypothetical protein
MSALQPRAIALQGLGYSQRLVSMQGLWPQGVTLASSGPARVLKMPPNTAADDDLLLLLAASMIIASNRIH